MIFLSFFRFPWIISTETENVSFTFEMIFSTARTEYFEWSGKWKYKMLHKASSPMFLIRVCECVCARAGEGCTKSVNIVRARRCGETFTPSAYRHSAKTHCWLCEVNWESARSRLSENAEVASGGKYIYTKLTQSWGCGGKFFFSLIVEIFISRSKSGETFENFAATLVSSLSAPKFDTH